MEQTQGYFNNLGDVTVASIQSAWYQLLQYLPKLIGALIILIVGLIIASIVSSIVRKAIQLTGIDATVEKSNLNQKLKVSGKYKLISGILSQFVKWFIIIATFIAVANTLNLPQLTEFLNAVVLYIPRVIAAVVILVAGMLLADFVVGLIGGAIDASRLPVRHKKTLVSVAKYAIIVFSVMAALTQLNVVPELIEILFGGLVLTMALAFGLGGKDEAARFLHSFREEK